MHYFLVDFIQEPSIVSNENGEVIYFDDWEKATRFAEETLQNGIVVPLASGIMYVINDAYKAVQNAKLKLGEDWDKGGEESVEGKLGTLLGIGEQN